jgi:hypothetical protein
MIMWSDFQVLIRARREYLSKVDANSIMILVVAFSPTLQKEAFV